MALTARLIRFILGVTIPLALIPIITSTIGGKEARCAYTMLLMAAYWVTEAVPIPVTALLPVIFFPLFDIMSTADACAPYMTATNMIFVAGLIMAVAIEHCNLHNRIALKVLLIIGTSTKRLLLGFMLSTGFLSMWISNTATTAMMVPILEAVILEIGKDEKEDFNDANNMQLKSTDEGIPFRTASIEPLKETKHSAKMTILRKGLFLSIAYSANIGGTGTLIGTGPNLVIQGVMNSKYPQSDDITFATWMMYAVPGMLVCLILAWLAIYLMFLRKSAKGENAESKDSIRDILQRKYDELGDVKFREAAVIVLFCLLILLLFLQDPKFIPGWAPALAKVAIKDATPAIAVAVLLFLIPSDPRNIATSPALLDWKTVQNKVPWGIIILLGGGFSMAKGFEVSKLSNWVKNQLTTLNVLGPDVLLVVLSLLTAGLTELTSNVATATAFLPVVADLAVALMVHPLFLMLPVALACSFAFMLPIATPPNAIVYEAAGMNTKDMAIPGFVMNIICCAVSVASVHTIGMVLFNLKTPPGWLNSDALTTSVPNITESFLNLSTLAYVNGR